MSYRNDISTLHASDLVSGGRTSPRGNKGESGGRVSPRSAAVVEERLETRHLRAENEHLRLCLRLMREQSELQTANLISSVIAWCDDRFRKKFADMSLDTRHGHGAVSPFRPISPAGVIPPVGHVSPTGVISPAGHFSPSGGISPAGHVSPSGVVSPAGHISQTGIISPAGHISPTGIISPVGHSTLLEQAQSYSNKDSTFGQFSPLTASQLGGRYVGTDNIYPADPTNTPDLMPGISRSKSPKQRLFSENESAHRDTQSSGTGTLSNAGFSSQGQQAFTFEGSGRVSPLPDRAPSPGSPYSEGGGPSRASPVQRPPSPMNSKLSSFADRPLPTDSRHSSRSRSPSPAFSNTSSKRHVETNFASTAPVRGGVYPEMAERNYHSVPGHHAPLFDLYERPESPPSGRASPIQTPPRSKSPNSINSFNSSQPGREKSRQQYNHSFRDPSVRLPGETEVTAAYNRHFPGLSNFSATLETQDIPDGFDNLTRPESSPFVPAGMGGHSKSQHLPGTQGMYQHPSGAYTISAPGTSTTLPPGETSWRQSFAQPSAPPRSPTPEPKSERSLTPFPDMHTKTLPVSMGAIREEMEKSLPSRGPTPSPLPSRGSTPPPGPSDMITFSHQYGNPLAASTPKKARTESSRIRSPSGVKSGRVKSPSGLRKSKRSPPRTPSPKGRGTPSPVSDDSFKAQSRRSATLVKPSHRILGEIAFQLERRILDYVFARQKHNDTRERGRRRFYGYTVSNIPMMILKESRRHDGTVDDHAEFRLKYRLKYVVTSLSPYGFSLDRHGIFSQEMINKYGLLSNAPDRKTLEAFGLADADTLREFVSRLAHSETEKRDVLVLLECLFVMASDDGRAIFLW